jgi:hypothetical protein
MTEAAKRLDRLDRLDKPSHCKAFRVSNLLMGVGQLNQPCDLLVQPSPNFNKGRDKVETATTQSICTFFVYSD